MLKKSIIHTYENTDTSTIITVNKISYLIDINLICLEPHEIVKEIHNLKEKV